MEAILRLESNAANTVDSLLTDLEAMLASERYVGSVWLRLEPSVLDQSRQLVSYVRTFLQALDKTVEHERDLLEKQGQKLFDLTREVLGIVKGITQGQVNSSSLLRRVTWSWKQQLALLHDLFADPGEDEETLPPEMMDSHHAEVATRADEISTNSHQQPALNGRVRGNAEHRHTPPAGASLQRKSAVSEKALFISSDTLCQGCGQCIDSQEHVVVQSHVYHRGCFMCCECGRMLETCHKVYAHRDKPCCPRCIYPVFDSPWSPHSTLANRVQIGEMKEDKRVSTVSVTASVAAALSHSQEDSPQLPDRLKSFSRDLKLSFNSLHRVHGDRKIAQCGLPSSQKDRNVSRSVSPPMASSVDWETPNSPPACKMTSRLSVSRSRAMKKVFSEGVLTRSSSDSAVLIMTDDSRDEPRFESLSSLEYILHNWIGLDHLLQYAVDEYIIEAVVFWLDVEHFKHFDGNQDDLAVYAGHIIAKYIVDGADLAVCLPARIRQQVLVKLDNPIHDMFDKAQNYMFAVIERDILDDFLKSEYGLQYLKALVDQDNEHKMEQKKNLEKLKRVQIKAQVTSFDKRRGDSKYYVYEVDVKVGQFSLVVYRRYSDFFHLNQALRAEFPHLSFSPFPKKILFGRSQVQSVASKRMGELNAYLQSILSMGPEVTNSHPVLMFFRQTEEDDEDEAFNRKLSVKGAGRQRVDFM